MALRDPEFGNIWRMVPNTIFHRNLSGELLPASIPERVVLESFSVTMKALPYDELEKFKTFVLASAGQEIKLIDFEGRPWVGIITSPTLDITKYRLARDCYYQVKFDFEGTVSDPVPPPPPIAQTRES